MLTLLSLQASKTFKIPPAAGGLWTAENRTSEAEGRALLPPPKAVWGSSGSGTHGYSQFETSN